MGSMMCIGLRMMMMMNTYEFEILNVLRTALHEVNDERIVFELSADFVKSRKVQ